jgi:hypothetical protein
MSFEDGQRSYALHELNRAFPAPASSAVGMDTIQAALGNTDPVMPPETRQVSDAVNFMATFGASSGAAQADAACRAQPYPSSGMRDPAARTGCGWWFVPSPSQPSTAAYGSRRGPMSPHLDTQAGTGQWIWDLAEAQRLEGMKRASNNVQTCEDLAYANFPNVGWCPSTNKAIVTDGQGNPAYAQYAGGDCPGGGIIMNASQCQIAPSGGGGGGGGGAGSGSGGISAQCQDGALSPACLQTLANQVCGAQGTLSQSYKSGWPASSGSFGAIHGIASRGFELDASLINGGGSTIQNALNNFTSLRQFAYTNTNPALIRAQSAAANLCGGQKFDPCALAAGDTAPFDPDCVTKALIAAGYKSTGGLMPSNGSMGYWNSLGTWGEVQTQINWHKAAADQPGFAGLAPEDQVREIGYVYGTKVQYPKMGCNVHGVAMYRYYFPTWDGTLFPQSGPQTHFLGRYLLKKGFPMQGSTMQDQTPAGGNLTEGQRMIANFVPQDGGNYQFLIQCDDWVRMQINDELHMEVGCCGQWQAGQIVALTPGTPYKLTIDLWNGGGPWSFGIQYSVNGGGWQPIPSSLLYMIEDRRLPMIELAFNQMQSTNMTQDQLNNGVPVSDTAGVMNNLVMAANVGQLNGRQCMIVDAPVRGIFNYATFNQGVRLCAIKSFTMMVQINSVAYPSGTTPSIVSFFNLPQSAAVGYPRRGWDQSHVQPYFKRTNDFMITTNGPLMYPYGVGPLVNTNNVAQSYFGDGVGRGSAVSIPQGQWFHYAWVWDDDFTGYTIYINGKQAGRSFMAPYDQNLMMEQIRIGCDNHPEGQSWTGGIAWFRAFDYRLSTDLIQRDMNDDWVNV